MTRIQKIMISFHLSFISTCEICLAICTPSKKFISLFSILRQRHFINILFISFFSAFIFSCGDKEKETVKTKARIFEGYHPLLDEIVRSKDGVFRGINLNSKAELIKKNENTAPIEAADGHLFFEYKSDSLMHYSIDYALNKDSLEEINVQINCDDLELTSYLFCDLKDYYANKLPNPTEDKGYVVYNCYEGQRKPFVVTLSDNSSPTKGIINMVIYKDK
jgi:hypothetical protein